MTREQYLLVCLIEECSEISKEAAKILRFGKGDVNPDDPDGPNNIKRLLLELIDFTAIVEMLRDDGFSTEFLTSDEEYEKNLSKKKIKVEHFMKYSKKKGLLT
jgi:hypothetical protein